jgi:high-affinity iron transporter
MRFNLIVLAALCLALTACSDDVTRGRELYAEHGCAVCHGAEGRGDGPSAKRLATPPRDLTNMRLYREGASSDAIAKTIRSGSGRNNAMPAFTDITPDEARQIGEWLVSLQKSPIAQ